jgi:hypothetical protein
VIAAFGSCSDNARRYFAGHIRRWPGVVGIEDEMRINSRARVNFISSSLPEDARPITGRGVQSIAITDSTVSRIIDDQLSTSPSCLNLKA